MTAFISTNASTESNAPEFFRGWLSKHLNLKLVVVYLMQVVIFNLFWRCALKSQIKAHKVKEQNTIAIWISPSALFKDEAGPTPPPR